MSGEDLLVDKFPWDSVSDFAPRKQMNFERRRNRPAFSRTFARKLIDSCGEHDFPGASSNGLVARQRGNLDVLHLRSAR